jgi:general secretion pathway protein H
MCDCTRHPRGCAAAPAFTLIEVVLVVAVLALLASVAIVRTGGAITNTRARMAVERVAADLALARDRAMTSGAVYKVAFNKLTYQVATVAAFESGDPGPAVDLGAEPYRADDLTADFKGETSVTFDPYGSASVDGKVSVTVAGVQRTLSLDAMTGRAVVE